MPVVVRSYKSLEVANPDIPLQGKCLAVDSKKSATGATGADELCLADTVGGVSNQMHLCPRHLRKPLLLIEDFRGTRTAGFGRYCKNTACKKVLDIGNFTGFATVCNIHRTGATMLGRKAVLPPVDEAFYGVAVTEPRLESLVAGSANLHKRDLTRCDVITCTVLLETQKTGLCPKHVKVIFPCVSALSPHVVLLHAMPGTCC